MQDSEWIFELVGLRPVVVPDLGRQALLLPRWGIILIDSAADVAAVSDWALARAAARLQDRPRHP